MHNLAATAHSGVNMGAHHPVAVSLRAHADMFMVMPAGMRRYQSSLFSTMSWAAEAPRYLATKYMFSESDFVVKVHAGGAGAGGGVVGWPATPAGTGAAGRQATRVKQLAAGRVHANGPNCVQLYRARLLTGDLEQVLCDIAHARSGGAGLARQPAARTQPNWQS